MPRRAQPRATINVEADFSKGMIRDVPRHAIPPGGVYDAADFLLHQPGVAQKRGGTAYASPVLGTGFPVPLVSYAAFPGVAAGQLLGVAFDSGAGFYKLYKITDASTATSKGQYYGGAGYLGFVESPKLWIGGGKTLHILGGRPLQKYDGTTLSILGSNTTVNANGNSNDATITVVSTAAFPSSGTFWIASVTQRADEVSYTGKTATTFTGCTTPTGGGNAIVVGNIVTNTPQIAAAYEIYKTRLVVGGVGGDGGSASSSPNRSYFSPIPSIETNWDTANSYIDSDYPIVGYAALSSALLIFNEAHTERLTGSTPPPNSDMDRAVINGVGCTDNRSIVIYNDNAIYANPRGVYMTNGAQTISLTELGGIGSYWKSKLVGYDRSTWVIAAGLYRDFYFLTVNPNDTNNMFTLACHVPDRSWCRHTNIRALSYAMSVGVAEDLYTGQYGDTARVHALSGLFTPTSANKNDADGTAVTPLLETRALGRGPTLKHFGFGHLSYDMRDAASNNPTLAVSVAPGLEATTYAAVAESPLAENTDETRARFAISKVSQGVSLKFQQTNASSKTELYAVEYEERPLAPVEGGQ